MRYPACPEKSQRFGVVEQSDQIQADLNRQVFEVQEGKLEVGAHVTLGMPQDRDTQRFTFHEAR